MDLRTARTIKRLRQYDLRIMTGIHQTKISHMENGLVFPSQDEKTKIAKALGISVGSIDWPESEQV